MHDPINLRKEVSGSVDAVINRVTKALAAEGFGVLTRIDLDRKIHEKTGKSLPRTVILGACNPQLAYEAFRANPDVASLLPCNAVIREVEAGRVAVELAKPSALMRALGDESLVKLAATADDRLGHALAGV